MQSITVSSRVFPRKFDLPYHIAMRWLNCIKVLCRLCKLRTKVYIFSAKNKIDRLHSDNICLSKLSYLVDITSHMSELNLKLHEMDNLVCVLYRIIEGVRRKLSLFESQLEKKTFQIFSISESFALQSTKKSTLVF